MSCTVSPIPSGVYYHLKALSGQVDAVPLSCRASVVQLDIYFAGFKLELYFSGIKKKTKPLVHTIRSSHCRYWPLEVFHLWFHLQWWKSAAMRFAGSRQRIAIPALCTLEISFKYTPVHVFCCWRSFSSEKTEQVHWPAQVLSFYFQMVWLFQLLCYRFPSPWD